MSSQGKPETPLETETSFEELRARLDDPSLVIVNVLSAEAFAQARIPGSLHLPLSAIPGSAREALPDPGADIVVCCGGPT